MKKQFDVEKFGKVAVLLGGLSAEREVSLDGGKMVFDALKRQGVNAYALDVKEDVVERLKEGNYDRAFIVLHGRGGEDGEIQAILEELNIPYTGSGVEASALAMNKIKTKDLLKQHNIPTLPFVLLNDVNQLNELVEKFGYPLCVKPVHEGSSNGVTKVDEAAQFAKACECAWSFDSDIMVEPWIEGEEYTVSVLENKALPSIKICPVGDAFYDYHAKYQSDETQFICPSDLSAEDEKYLQDFAEQTYRVVGCSGWARIDCLRDKAGKFWINEANTIPGITSHSLFPRAAAAAGIDFDELVLRILVTSL